MGSDELLDSEFDDLYEVSRSRPEKYRFLSTREGVDPGSETA